MIDGTVVEYDEYDAVVDDDAVDYLDHGYIQVYEMFAHNDAQKTDDMLQEKNGDTLEQQGVDDDQKDDGKIHNTVEEVELDDSNNHQQKDNQDEQEDPQMNMSPHNMFDDEQQQVIHQNQGTQESELGMLLRMSTSINRIRTARLIIILREIIKIVLTVIGME